jgi:hypothetical protein
MTKLRNNPIEKTDIEEYAENYSDFSFELKVLSELTRLGFTCQHSGVYEDPVTEKIREFDIKAYIRVGQDEYNYQQLSTEDILPRRSTSSKKIVTIKREHEIQLAVECKNLGNNYPLVVHCVPRERTESFLEVFYSCYHTGGIAPIFPTERAKIYRLTSRQNFYIEGELVAKSRAQVGRDNNGIKSNDGEVFDKISQAINSAHDLVNDCYFKGEETQEYYTYIIPVLVIPDGKLWQISYDRNGKSIGEPEQITAISHYIGQPWTVEVTYTISHLEIVTLSGLENFVRKLIPANFSVDGFIVDIIEDNRGLFLTISVTTHQSV